jgi:hypothetical protein
MWLLDQDTGGESDTRERLWSRMAAEPLNVNEWWDRGLFSVRILECNEHTSGLTKNPQPSQCVAVLNYIYCVCNLPFPKMYPKHILRDFDKATGGF